jgi:hypothetical protein
MRWISGTMVSFVPPASRIEPRSYNNADSSGVFTSVRRKIRKVMRYEYLDGHY